MSEKSMFLCEKYVLCVKYMFCVSKVCFVREKYVEWVRWDCIGRLHGVRIRV